MNKDKLLKQYDEVKDELEQQFNILKQTQRRIDHLIKKCHKLEDKICDDK